MFFNSFIAMEYVYIVFFTVNSSVNAARSSLNGVCRRKFHGKGIKLKTFPEGYVISLCDVVQSGYSGREKSRRAEGGGLKSYSVPYFSFLFSFSLSLFLSIFPVFCVVVFYKYLPK